MTTSQKLSVLSEKNYIREGFFCISWNPSHQRNGFKDNKCESVTRRNWLHYACVNQRRKEQTSKQMLQNNIVVCSFCRRWLCCPLPPMPITERCRPLTFCSLPTPPTIWGSSAKGVDCGWGWEGAMGWRAAPPSDRHQRGRATKWAAAAATEN